MKILLFGAYGNGNIGDTYQANSVKSLLEKVFPKADFFATSYSSANMPYEFLGGKILDRNFITQLDELNSFDILVIGGGGLLASKHRPLESAIWAEQLQLPVHIFAVGANEQTCRMCQEIVMKAVTVSGRDPYSLEAINAVRGQSHWLPDPILVDFYNYPYPQKPKSFDRGNICWIPRKITNKNLKQVKLITNLFPERDTVISMFPATDKNSGFENIFGDSVNYLYSMSDLIARIKEHDLIVSSRYHGCIMGLKCGIPTIGLLDKKSDESYKILQLYRMLGKEDLIIQLTEEHTRDNLIEIAKSSFDFFEMKNKLLEMEFSFSNNMFSLFS